MFLRKFTEPKKQECQFETTIIHKKLCESYNVNNRYNTINKYNIIFEF